MKARSSGSRHRFLLRISKARGGVLRPRRIRPVPAAVHALSGRSTAWESASDGRLATSRSFRGNVKLAMSHVVPDLVQKVLKGQDPLHILGDGTQIRHYTYGGDLARGIVTAMEHPAARNEDFNLSTDTVDNGARVGRDHLAEDPRGRDPVPVRLGRALCPRCCSTGARDGEGEARPRLRGNDLAGSDAGRCDPVDRKGSRRRGDLKPAQFPVLPCRVCADGANGLTRRSEHRLIGPSYRVAKEPRASGAVLPCGPCRKAARGQAGRASPHPWPLPSTVSWCSGCPTVGQMLVQGLLCRLGLRPLGGASAPVELTRFNDRLLEAAGGSRERLPEIAPSEVSRLLGGFEAEARTLFADIAPVPDGSGESSPWVWADPTNSFLTPFWIKALGIRAALVLVHRDPEEVVALRRTGPVADAAILDQWDRHNRVAMVHCSQWPSLVLSYEELVAKPKESIFELSEFVERCGYPVTADAEEAAQRVDRLPLGSNHPEQHGIGGRPLPSAGTGIGSTRWHPLRRR